MYSVFLFSLGAMLLTAESPMNERPVDSVRYKPGKGLQVVSKDGDFGLTTRLRAQMLYTLDKTNDWTQAFEIRRARLLFTGNVFGQHNKYKFELAVSPKDIGLQVGEGLSRAPLLDWYFVFDHHRDATIQVGQFKVPYSKQRVVSSGNLQMVERSVVNAEFNLDRDLGINVQSKNLFGLDMLRYWAGIYMGEGHSSHTAGDFGMMYLGRIEYLPLGLFSDYSEGALRRESEPKLSLGLGYGLVEQGKGNRGILGPAPSDGGTTDTQNVTADLSFRYSALSLESAFFWRKGTRNPGAKMPVEAVRDGLGFYVQGGVLVSSRTELATRYGQVIPETTETSLLERSELGLSVNHYFAEHAMKIQGDIHQYWGNQKFLDGNTVMRVQLQVAY